MRYYDRCATGGKTHPQALRALANRLVGILHGCLRHRSPYRESQAWPSHRPERCLTPTSPWDV